MDVSTLFASFSSAAELVKLLVNERDRQKAATIHIEFTEKLIEAQAQLLQVLGAVAEQQRQIPVLEQRIRELEAGRAEKERYELAVLGVGGEFFAYRLRRAGELLERADEVPHFVCQPCFEAGNKVVLCGDGSGYWWCPVCRHGGGS